MEKQEESEDEVIDLIKVAGPKLFSEIFDVDLKQSEKFFNYLNKKNQNENKGI